MPWTDCGDTSVPHTLVILKNRIFSWSPIDILEPEIAGAEFSGYRGYLFQQVYGTDFPFFFVYAYENDNFSILYNDFGLLPVLDQMFVHGDHPYDFNISGRNGTIKIVYNQETREYQKLKLERDHEISNIYIISGEGREYTVEGETVTEETSPARISFSSLSVVFVPSHCGVEGLIETPDFPGYYVREASADVHRVCCPTDPEEFGTCDVVIELE